VGAWIGACTLDVAAAVSASGRDREGIERAATILIATGLVSLPVAALPGFMDWSRLRPEQQRIGLVHAGVNALAAACMGASLVARTRGHRGRGLEWAFGGVALAGTGAAIGGHLAYRFAAGADHADHAADVSQVAAGEWTEIGRLDELPQRRPQSRSVGARRVVVVRRGDEVNVLADTCSHLSGPLSDGMISELGGRDCVVCPWHGSTFDLESGQVVHGPATAPAPVFAARVVDGIVSARAGNPHRRGNPRQVDRSHRATRAFTFPWR
jgi:nitrite reductase/ring-hydroxylating ferredoxin subunit